MDMKHHYLPGSGLSHQHPGVLVLLLVTYALFSGQAVAAWLFGVPSIDMFAGETYGNAWPVLLLLCSLGAALGVSLSPRARVLELASTVGIIALFFGYGSVLIIWGVMLDPARLPIGIGMFGYTSLSLWRISVLMRTPPVKTS